MDIKITIQFRPFVWEQLKFAAVELHEETRNTSKIRTPLDAAIYLAFEVLGKVDPERVIPELDALAELPYLDDEHDELCPGIPNPEDSHTIELPAEAVAILVKHYGWIQQRAMIGQPTLQDALRYLVLHALRERRSLAEERAKGIQDEYAALMRASGMEAPSQPQPQIIDTNKLSSADLKRIAYLVEDIEQVIRDLAKRSESGRVLCDELKRQNTLARELARGRE